MTKEVDYVGGQAVDKILTDGGHPAETTQQPAFPDFHRKLADPSPFAWFALGAPLIIWGLTFIGARGIDMERVNVVIAPISGLGFVLLTFATISEYLCGRTFPATLFGVYAGFFGGFSVLHISWFGLTGSYDGTTPNTYATGGQAAGEYNSIQGLWMSTFVILTILLLLAATRQSVVVCLFLTFLEVFNITSMVHYFKDGQVAGISNAAGAFGIVSGLIAWYAATASLLTSDSSFFTVPMFKLVQDD